MNTYHLTYLLGFLNWGVTSDMCFNVIVTTLNTGKQLIDKWNKK